MCSSDKSSRANPLDGNTGLLSVLIARSARSVQRRRWMRCLRRERKVEVKRIALILFQSIDSSSSITVDSVAPARYKLRAVRAFSTGRINIRRGFTEHGNESEIFTPRSIAIPDLGARETFSGDGRDHFAPSYAR